MNRIFLALGSNIPNRIIFLLKAILEISKIDKTTIKNISRFYKTKPYGNINQDYFINCCIEIESLLSPQKLLRELKNIEHKIGRKKREKWGPREIDIDILFYNNFIIDEPGLQIPHPDLQNRIFVLVPLNDIDAKLIHPILNKSIGELLSSLGKEKEAEIEVLE